MSLGNVLYGTWGLEPDLRPEVRYALLRLREYATTLNVVTNQRELSEQAMRFLHEIGAPVTFVENRSRIFGMFHQYFTRHGTAGAMNGLPLTLVNDSVLVVNSLHRVAKWMGEHDDLAVAGLSDISYPHTTDENHAIAAYFIRYSPQFLPNLFNHFSAWGIDYTDDEMVWHYEFGLSKLATSIGMPIGSMAQTLWPASRSWESVGEAVLKAGAPVVKRATLWTERGRRGVPDWFEVVKAHADPSIVGPDGWLQDPFAMPAGYAFKSVAHRVATFRNDPV